MKWSRGLCVALLSILHPSSFILSQETEPPRKLGVKLQFVPPPMEGTISLGIYDAKGKLVRTLHREAEIEGDTFGKALNGLITYWDGKSDAGLPMPAGKYSARGFMVGDIKCEGEALHCNDWIADDESPRVRRIKNIGVTETDLVFVTETADGATDFVHCDFDGKITSHDAIPEWPLIETTNGESLTAAAKQLKKQGGGLILTPGVLRFSNVKTSDGKLLVNDSHFFEELKLPEGDRVTNACEGPWKKAWAIVTSSNGIEVREYSFTGEFQRRLAISPSDPPPKEIAASKTTDHILLLEQDAKSQRVRSLFLVSGTDSQPANSEQPVSTWKVIFQKTITFCDTLEAVRDKLKFPNGKPFVPQEKIKVDLQPNPLTPDQPASVEIAIGIDAKGSFFKTADGLELDRVSVTQNLRWAVLGRAKDSRIVSVFQSDGAVVEEFRARGLADMMAFDCGDFDYDPAKDK